MVHLHDGQDHESHDLAAYSHILRKHGRNLRRLDFEPALGNNYVSECGDDGFIDGICDELIHLEQLRVPLGALVGAWLEIGHVPDLCKALPASLRWFWTVATTTADTGLHHEAVYSMLLRAREELPLLEWVLVINEDDRDNEGEDDGDDDGDGDCGVMDYGEFEASPFGGRHVLYRKRPESGVVDTPLGWEGEIIEEDVYLGD